MTTTSRLDLTNDEYRKISAISNSDLSLVSKSTALLEWNRNAPRGASDTSNIGTATHAALLEPEEFAKDYLKMPSLDLRTKAGKADKEQFIASSEGKIVLDAKDYDLIIGMRDSVLAHPVANRLLTCSGSSEESIFFDLDGVKCKARADRIPDHKELGFNCIVDVKTTADISKFGYSARDYRYHCQAAFYSLAYEKLHGVKPRFIFVVVSKGKTFGKHEVRVFELTPEDMDEGLSLVLEDLEKVKEYQDFGVGLEIETLNLPKKWK
mgnify:CR=1 FL=1